MLDSNDIQIICTNIKLALQEFTLDNSELRVRLEESQEEANLLSAQVCAKEKQLQQVKQLLGTAEWLDEGQELVTITRKDYNKMIDIINGGIV